MALSATVKLPKLVSTTDYTLSLTAVATSEDTGTKRWFSARRASINPPSFDVAGTIETTGGTSTVTASTAGGFASVAVGDAVSLAPGNASGAVLSATTVATKVDDSTITLADAATNDGSGASTLRFDPPGITPTLYAIEERHTYSGGTIRVEIWKYLYDGTLGATAGTTANATSSEKIGEFTIPAGDYLDNLRVVRSNSDTVSL
ncbi:MAG TPA: hypothetical protein V6C65_04390 [Allocoleopsis sp.]